MRRETRDRTYRQRTSSENEIVTEFEQFLLDLESNGTILIRLETRELSDAESLAAMNDDLLLD